MWNGLFLGMRETSLRVRAKMPYAVVLIKYIRVRICENAYLGSEAAELNRVIALAHHVKT